MSKTKTQNKQSGAKKSKSSVKPLNTKKKSCGKKCKANTATPATVPAQKLTFWQRIVKFLHAIG